MNKVQTKGDSSPIGEASDQSEINQNVGSIDKSFNIQIVNNNYGSPPTQTELGDRETVRLWEFIDDPTRPVIYKRDFTHKRIEGPVVVCFLEDMILTGCTWEANWDTFLIEIPADWHTPSGVVYLKKCQFTDCEFVNVAILGHEDHLKRIREAFEYHE